MAKLRPAQTPAEMEKEIASGLEVSSSSSSGRLCSDLSFFRSELNLNEPTLDTVFTAGEKFAVRMKRAEVLSWIYLRQGESEVSLASTIYAVRSY